MRQRGSSTFPRAKERNYQRDAYICFDCVSRPLDTKGNDDAGDDDAATGNDDFRLKSVNGRCLEKYDATKDDLGQT